MNGSHLATTNRLLDEQVIPGMNHMEFTFSRHKQADSTIGINVNRRRRIMLHRSNHVRKKKKKNYTDPTTSG